MKLALVLLVLVACKKDATVTCEKLVEYQRSCMQETDDELWMEVCRSVVEDGDESNGVAHMARCAGSSATCDEYVDCVARFAPR